MSTNAATSGAPRRARNTEYEHDLDVRPLLGVSEVADILGVPRATLYRWHSLSSPEQIVGPRAFRVGKYLRYTLEDLREYIEVQRGAAPSWQA
jgi:hypothetical protein